MDRLEPTLTAPGLASGTTPFAGWDSTQRFSVRYSIKPSGKPGLLSAIRYSSGINGQLSFSDDSITLRRSRNTENNTEQRNLPRAEIFDIQLAHHRISFDLHRAQGGVEHVVLKASSEEDVRRIVELLPAQMTPAFAAERIALTTFKDKLSALTRFTWVTYLLIALNVMVFLAMCRAGVGVMKVDPVAIVGWGTNFGPYTLGDEPWRLITSMFVHFGLIHITFNMIALYAVGRLTERLYGNMRFLALYLFAGLTGSIASVLAHPTINSAGASGAIFGVAGGLLIFVLRFRKELPASIAARNRSAMWVFIVINLLDGFRHRGTDNAAHLGGLVGGLLIGALLARPLDNAARERHSFRSALLSTLMACVTLGALTYPLTHVSKAKREEIQFSKLLVELSAQEKHAIDDTRAWQHMKMHSQIERDAASNKLFVDILPQWEALYTSVENTRLPDGSPRTALRQAMLRYLDDNRRIVRTGAVMLSHTEDNDPVATASLRALSQDSKEQAALVKKLGAATGSPPR
ncbi:rhomboid family intramembrane serine protease [Paraburkholderia agricolaris]|uniref:rhomboid family intramembrane serine protease n=1 Tax=Paraburkholderia agricolaris TaxID=2152888 RepID=UPI0012917D91|nr:rhomboid family intramembrane serine protease [Paraburkholderia agricolaris]